MKDTVAIVKSLLYAYRYNKSELNELIKTKSSFEEQIKYFKEHIPESKEEIIEALSLKAVQLSHIPKSITNKINSTVENIIVHQGEKLNSTEENLINNSNTYLKLKVRIQELQVNISLAENMVDCLNDKKRFIIKHKYFHGYTIPEVVTYYNSTFPIPKEIKTIASMKIEAEREMARWYDGRITN